MEKVTDAVDTIGKIASILDYLASEAKNNGLCSILDFCHNELLQAAQSLESFTTEPKA